MIFTSSISSLCHTFTPVPLASPKEVKAPQRRARMPGKERLVSERWVRWGRCADCRARRKERRDWKGWWVEAVRERCCKCGKGGSGIASVGLRSWGSSDRAMVRWVHCGEVEWRAEICSAEKMLRGKRIVRFEKTEGFAESIQVFVVGDTRRRESLDGRGRRERRRVAGKAGMLFRWYKMFTEIGCFSWTSRRSKGERREADMSVNSLKIVC